jgi:hypothetical protein
MIFIDDMHGIEVVEEAVSECTNFAALDLVPGAELEGFLTRVGFPRHALVLRCGERVNKGIDTREELAGLLSSCTSRARIETDMRAHVNPTRMTEIGRLAATLAKRIATPCPSCAAPGFGIVRREAGLPCADCETPTTLVTRRSQRRFPCRMPGVQSMSLSHLDRLEAEAIHIIRETAAQFSKPARLIRSARTRQRFCISAPRPI